MADLAEDTVGLGTRTQSAEEPLVTEMVMRGYARHARMPGSAPDSLELYR
jgi:hypothetical protein